MWFRNKPIRPEQRIRIRLNALLRGPEKALKLSEVLLLRKSYDKVKDSGSSAANNLSSVSERQLKDVHSTYGESGLFKLVFLVHAHGEADFAHFLKPILAGLDILRSVSAEKDLECDNYKLRQCPDLGNLNWNIIQPSLSRKLYNPGCRHGYMVYGLGGPRILVSHPFQGISGEVYDVYNNSVDVVTSLMRRGYVGTFLLLDNLPGLNFQVKGFPAWLLWFSIVASQSDLVVFIKEYEEDFKESQRMEVEFTPDRVQKKLVEIPLKELRWATKPEIDDVRRYLYIGAKGGPTREDFYKDEAELAAPFIEQYVSLGLPRDRLIRIGESGELTEYPLDYPVYGAVRAGY